jgi:hypothetical protein
MVSMSAPIAKGTVLRACALRFAAALVCVFALVQAAQAAITGEVKVTQEDGFTRLAFRFAEHVGVDVKQSNGIAILTFAEPVDVAVEQLAKSAPALIGAARRDPDGRGIRIALKRKLRLNSVPAAEWFFLDLLPETWSGLMPGAPQAVVDELARRARAAEKEVRALSGTKPSVPVAARVRVAVQPTFTRFVFPLPDGAQVEPDRRDDALTLTFSRAIDFDLAEARAALPTEVTAIASEHDAASTQVRFDVLAAGSVRSFRDGATFVVDVDSSGGTHDPQTAPAAPPIAAPESVPAPAQSASPPASAKAAQEQGAPAPAAAQPAAEASPAPAKAETHPGKPVVAEAPMPQPRPSIAAAAPQPKKPAANQKGPVAVAIHQADHALKLVFPFAAPTPAAVFQRGDALWLVFDSAAPLDPAALKGDLAGVRKTALIRNRGGEIVLRLTLDRPRLVGADADGGTWTVTIGDTLDRPPLPLSLARTVVGRNRANVVIPYDKAARVHRLTDPEGGERLIAITAAAPPRGLLKDQNFLEMRALASAQGLALQPLADDVQASVTADSVTVSRPGGLALSVAAAQQVAGARTTFDPKVWAADRAAPFVQRESELIAAAAAAPESRRWQPRLDVARFYLARELAAEAKGVLEVAMADGHPKNDITGSILSSIADIGLQRPARALKELSAPEIEDQQNAPLWRAVALAQEGKWAQARDGFKDLDTALATVPIDLQRVVLMTALRTAVEARDLPMAAHLIDVLEAVGVAPDSRPELALLIGREREELGQTKEALAGYRAAVASGDRLAAAEARLREISLELSNGELPRTDAIAALETLTMIWRGDDIEIGSLRLLARLYRDDGRYRDAFHAMRTAVLAAPNSPITRKMQDEAAASFQDLFLSGKADALPPVEALGLFYDYRDLTPIGRLGDEMIRKLADRLIAVDLLGQAAELLQHQVDKRLQGAARAQVAARLATVYLMDHKPDRALAALRATRDSDVADELRERRLLLEARALSDLGRQPLALEIISGMNTPEARRLRADVLWSAKRWREAAEEIERLYGERWREFKPLDETERSDILRAAIGYALADEGISLARLRDKYAVKMADGPDARAFEIVSSPIGPGGAEFRDVARRLGSLDTLAAFLRDMRKRYETDAKQDEAAAGPPARPLAPGVKPPAAPKGGTPLRPDPVPTGSVVKRK